MVGRAQLIALGFSRDEIGHDLEYRRLIRVHQGVYAVGHEALSDRGRMIAALLAAGPARCDPRGPAARRRSCSA